MSTIELLVMVIGYFGLMMLITWHIKPKDVNEYIAANPHKHYINSMSVAASWIWAPALLVSTKVGFLYGTAGLLWFLVPNVVCLLLFAWFAKTIRPTYPRGVTFSGYMTRRYSAGVGRIYQLQFVILSVCAFAVQLLAGSQIISAVTQTSSTTVAAVIMATVVVLYSVRSGFKASVLTDAIQYTFILVGSMIVLYVVGVDFGSFQPQNAIDMFPVSVFDPELILAFGIPVTIGLLAGPFGDQMFWQRALSMPYAKITSTFTNASAYFALVPISLGVAGILLAGNGFVADNASLAVLEYIMHSGSYWILAVFLVMILSGLFSTMDSCLCAFGSIVAEDYQRSIAFTRISMALLAVSAVAIASIPGISIFSLFLLYGCVRATTLLPTVMTLSNKFVLTSKSIIYGIAVSMFCGLPLFVTAQLSGDPVSITLASVFVVLLPGILAYCISYLERKR